MSRVDVIIPCYNYGHFLPECVGSVLSQSVDVRVLIIDDASPDGSARVAMDLAAQDHRVECRCHAVNRGNIATYNEGLEWTTGDYTLLLSADDLLVPGALLRASRLLDAHPEVGFVYGRALRFETDQPLPPAGLGGEPCEWRVLPGLDWLESVCREGSNPITSPEVLVRTRLQRELGGYLPELPYSGDLELWMRFAAVADVGILDADQAFYRIHSKNMSLGYVKSMGARDFRTALPDYQHRRAAFDLLFRNHGGRIAGHERLQSLANRGLAWNAFWTAYNAFEKSDSEDCQEFLDFALETFPELKHRPEWARLRWKRRLGRNLWSTLSPVVRLMCGRPRRNPVVQLP